MPHDLSVLARNGVAFVLHKEGSAERSSRGEGPDQSGDEFLVGLAAAVGAAISMGFSEGLSDDGSLTGRGDPILRGMITGVATFAGGILHTLPFLLPQVSVALYTAFAVVGVELLAISAVRYRYFNMSFLVSALQVFLGGAFVFASGVLIGNA